MEHSSGPGESQKNVERAQRILDVAAELLLRWGYKRVTIDDIARHAGVGKGTIYLHWKTRDSLFETVILREMIIIYRAVMQRIYADPLEILPHRMLPASLLITEERPIIKALLTRDIETAGKLIQNNAHGEIRNREEQTIREYFSLLYQHGLTAVDSNQPEHLYALEMLTTSFTMLDPYIVSGQQLSIEQKAGVLARIIRQTFEPPTPPALAVVQEIAPAIIQLFEQLCLDFEQKIRAQTEL
ncbi:TetR/AcrR family transcriptional regulator [Dictyobacter aurantiacus]|uniref:TetR family transcriptional regulator n=1 Tax=Dictyobacter aurantiacus TaxID=1936993 RepID=A0A401ZSD1_9CHLR|nr:TetR/AcrR family transcriptional regulator [Dictyobacter aurantiacus]GCE09775.1 TetR family transcriptional regulator [Dictyobacter aurantiacus]